MALLNETAVLACMQYIDLNPIRAGMAETPETSDFTSAQDRLASRQARKKLQAYREEQKREIQAKQTLEQGEMILKAQNEASRDHWLSPIKRYISSDESLALNLSLDEYLELLDWTGRHMKEGKRGHIPKHLETILIRMDVETEEWLNTVKHFGSMFYRVAGSVKSILKAAQQAGQKWLKGKTPAKTAFG